MVDTGEAALIYREIVVDESYLRPGHPATEPQVIVDIGLAPVFFERRLPQALVDAAEPAPDPYRARPDRSARFLDQLAGSMKLQATRPRTVADGLTDSPVGQLFRRCEPDLFVADLREFARLVRKSSRRSGGSYLALGGVRKGRLRGRRGGGVLLHCAATEGDPRGRLTDQSAGDQAMRGRGVGPGPA